MTKKEVDLYISNSPSGTASVVVRCYSGKGRFVSSLRCSIPNTWQDPSTWYHPGYLVRDHNDDQKPTTKIQCTPPPPLLEETFRTWLRVCLLNKEDCSQWSSHTVQRQWPSTILHFFYKFEMYFNLLNFLRCSTIHLEKNHVCIF